MSGHDHSHAPPAGAIDWREHGVKVIPGSSVDPNTPQTPGMSRAAAVDRARAGAEKIWAGTVTIHANAKTGAHHHGDLESIIYVVKGRARMRWGDRLEYVAEADPGDFISCPLRAAPGYQCSRERRWMRVILRPEPLWSSRHRHGRRREGALD